MNAYVKRSVDVTINEIEYEMMLTVSATAEIYRKFGGMDELINVLTSEYTENITDAGADLIAILCNGGTERHNYLHKDDPKQLISADEIRITITPNEMADLLEKAIIAVKIGQGTYIEDTSSEKK